MSKRQDERTEQKPKRKELFWGPEGPLKSPPASHEGRMKTGTELRLIQEGQAPAPSNGWKPRPDIGKRVHQLTVRDAKAKVSWRVFVRLEPDAVVVLYWVTKKTQQSPKKVTAVCKERLATLEKALKG